MKRLIYLLCLFFTSLPSFAQIDEGQQLKFNFQVGISSYNFNDGNGLDVSSGLFSLFGEQSSIPLLRANLLIGRTKLSTSIEDFSKGYVCACDLNDREFLLSDKFKGLIHYRSFRLLTLSYGYDLVDNNVIAVIPSLGVSKRFNPGDSYGEYWVDSFSVHYELENGTIFYRPNSNVNRFNDWAFTPQLEVQISFLKRFSVSGRFEYYFFANDPRRQWGMSGLLGVSF